MLGTTLEASMLERLHCSIASCAAAGAGAMRARLTLNPKLGIVASKSRTSIFSELQTLYPNFLYSELSKQSRNLVQPLKGASHLVKPHILAGSVPYELTARAAASFCYEQACKATRDDGQY